MPHVVARQRMLTTLPTGSDPNPHKEADLEVRLREFPRVALSEDTREALGVVVYTSSSRGDRAL